MDSENKRDEHVSPQYYPFDTCDPAEYDEEYLRMPRRYKHARTIQNEIVCSGLRGSSAKPAVVVDLGSGTANDGLYILKNVGESFYLGIDRSSPMITRARDKMRNQGFDGRSVFLQQDFHITTIRDFKRHIRCLKIQGRVAIVMSVLALHHSERAAKLRVYRLAHQLLASGGRFVLTDLFSNNIMDCKQLALQKELSDVRSMKVRFANRSPAGIAASTMNEDHYVQSNKPMSLTLELDYLRESGFHLVDVVFRDGQLAVVVAENFL